MVASLPPALYCSVSESAHLGSPLACTPDALAALPAASKSALSLSAVTAAGMPHPFLVDTALSASHARIALGPSLRLDYNSQQQYNVSMWVCLPQLVSVFTAWNAPLDFTTCVSSAAHVTAAVSVSIVVLEANKAPTFSRSSVTFIFPIASVVNATVGVPLLQYVTDANTKAPWNVVTFAVTAQNTSSSSSSSSSNTALFAIQPSTGQLLYAVRATQFVGWAWLTVSAVDGGGLSTSLTVLIAFSTSPVQLSVAPNALTIVHYAPGVSMASMGVVLDAGSWFGATWGFDTPTASLASPLSASVWLTVTKAAVSSTLQLQLNSTAFAEAELGSLSSLAASVTVFTTLANGTRSLPEYVVTVELLLQFPRVAVSPQSIGHLLRVDSRAGARCALLLLLF